MCTLAKLDNRASSSIGGPLTPFMIQFQYFIATADNLIVQITMTLIIRVVQLFVLLPIVTMEDHMRPSVFFLSMKLSAICEKNVTGLRNQTWSSMHYHLPGLEGIIENRGERPSFKIDPEVHSKCSNNGKKHVWLLLLYKFNHNAKTQTCRHSFRPDRQ